MCLAAPAAAHAAVSSPPDPPPPIGCNACSGPPPPPDPAPTVAPTMVAPQPAVDIHLGTPRVSRGHTAKLAVNASTDDQVTVLVRYRGGKSTTFHAKVGGSGTLIKTWTVPKTAPLGKATVKVTVDGSDDTVSKSVTLVVTK